MRSLLAASGPDAARVIRQCAMLRDGERLDDDAPLTANDVVDVLPPFAGG